MVAERKVGTSNFDKAPSHADELPALFTAVEKAKGPEEKTSAVNAVVRYALDESFDRLTLEFATNRAVVSVLKTAPHKSQRSTGYAVLQGLNDGIVARGSLHKVEMASDRRYAERLTEASVNEHLRNIALLKTRGVEMPRVLKQALFSLSTRMERQSDPQARILAIEHYSPVTRTEENAKAYDALLGDDGFYDQIATTARRVGDVYDATPERIRLPETIMGLVNKTAQFRVEGIPDLTTTICNGITFAEVFAETDQGQFNAKALQFLAGIPKGNALWSRIVEGIFFTDIPRKNLKSGTGSVYKDPEQIKRLLRFNYMLTNAAFFPAIDKEAKSPAANETISYLLNNLDYLATSGVCLTLTQGIEIPETFRKLFPDDEIGDNSGASFLSVTTRQLEKYPTELRDRLFITINNQFLQSNRQKFLEHLRMQFGTTRNFAQFRSIYDQFLALLKEGIPGEKEKPSDPSEEFSIAQFRLELTRKDPIVTSGENGKGSWSEKTSKSGERYFQWRKKSGERSPFNYISFFEGQEQEVYFSLGMENVSQSVVGQVDEGGMVIPLTHDLNLSRFRDVTEGFITRGVTEALADLKGFQASRQQFQDAIDRVREAAAALTQPFEFKLPTGMSDETTQKSSDLSPEKRRTQMTADELSEWFGQFVEEKSE